MKRRRLIMMLGLVMVLAGGMMAFGQGQPPRRPVPVYHEPSFNAGVIHALMAMEELWSISDTIPAIKKMPADRILKVLSLTATEIAKSKGAVVTVLSPTPPAPPKAPSPKAEVIIKGDNNEVVQPTDTVDPPEHKHTER